MDKGSIKIFDKSNMFAKLTGFGNQIREACKIGEDLEKLKPHQAKEILICGMGGSAIAGNLLMNYASFTTGAEHLKIKVNRGYQIPKNIDSDTLAIISSYSGNTEETLSCYHEVELFSKKLLAMTTGGKLHKLATASNHHLVELTESYQPREAIALSFFPQLYYLMLGGSFKSGAVQITANAINELLKLIDSNSSKFNKENPENPTFAFAQEIKGKIPVVYSSIKYEAVNLRFRGQFQENSKIPAFGAILPEMNHNEINALENKEKCKDFHFILIVDDEENTRILKRVEFLESILKENNYSYSLIKPSGKNLLTRYFELINYADWTSYWLALLLGEDPTEIKTILKLKEFMSR